MSNYIKYGDIILLENKGYNLSICPQLSNLQIDNDPYCRNCSNAAEIKAIDNTIFKTISRNKEHDWVIAGFKEDGEFLRSGDTIKLYQRRDGVDGIYLAVCSYGKSDSTCLNSSQLSSGVKVYGCDDNLGDCVPEIRLDPRYKFRCEQRQWVIRKFGGGYIESGDDITLESKIQYRTTEGNNTFEDPMYLAMCSNGSKCNDPKYSNSKEVICNTQGASTDYNWKITTTKCNYSVLGCKDPGFDQYDVMNMSKPYWTEQMCQEDVERIAKSCEGRRYTYKFNNSRNVASISSKDLSPPTQPPTQPPIQPITQPPIQPITQPPTQPPIQPITQPPTQPPIQPITQPPTQPPIQPITQPPTQPITLPSTRPTNQPPTQPITLPSTQPSDKSKGWLVGIGVVVGILLIIVIIAIFYVSF